MLDRGNYRPVSLLSIPSKIYESIICDELDLHLNENNISNPHQWGFTKAKSTELLMLHYTEKWKAGLDEGKYIGVLFTDFKKAFDSISHETLALKLQACGVSSHLHKLIMSYLENREQYVEINGKRSERQEVKYGVPQGSLLGPRLFNIQVFDLPEVPNEGELEMFADNTEHYVIGNSADEISVIIEGVLQEINEWCKQNCLTVHPDKTEVMIISRKTIVGPLRPIKLEDHIVKYVTESKCLGMIVDNRLSWKNHIKKASVNLGKKVKQLKRMKSLPAEVLGTIYFRGILPSTTYGIGVWGSCSPQLLEDLERVHRRAGRIIHKIPKRVPQDQILEQAKWKSISFMYKKRIACLAHQAYNRKHPDVINDLVVKHVTNKNLRYNIKLEIPRSKTNAGKQSFRHRAPIIWNSLPEIAKAFKTYESFKKNLHNFNKIIVTISFNETSTVSFKDTDTFIYN
eukprot:gene14433-15937_t